MCSRGQIVEWDVVNEPFTNHALIDLLGKDVLVDWFKLARQSDPDPRLFLNDYPTLGSGSAHEQHFEKTLQFLLDRATPGRDRRAVPR